MINRYRLLGTLLICAALLMACARPDDETRLRETIAQMETDAEQGRLAAVLNRVHEGFTGQGGSIDRQTLKRLLGAQLLRHTRSEAVVTGLAIDITGASAKADFKLLVVGANQSFVPENGRLYSVETNWVKDGGDWILLSASWD